MAKAKPRTQTQIRKEEILNQSARLFRKKGYSATTMRMIAAAVNIEAASLYNHISSKQAILREILLPMARRFSEGMEAILQQQKSPLAQLEALVDLHIQLTLQHPDPISLITGEWVHLEEPALTQYLQLRNAYESRFKAILETGIQNGQFAPLHVDTALFSLLSTLHWLYSWISRHKELNVDTIRSEIRQSLLFGLVRR
jgi:AcrR family transcriptional regulator